MPIPVAERSKARVYVRSLAGIAGSNPTQGRGGEMYISCEYCAVKQRSLRPADPSSRGVLPAMVCRCVCVSTTIYIFRQLQCTLQEHILVLLADGYKYEPKNKGIALYSWTSAVYW